MAGKAVQAPAALVVVLAPAWGLVVGLVLADLVAAGNSVLGVHRMATEFRNSQACKKTPGVSITPGVF